MNRAALAAAVVALAIAQPARAQGSRGFDAVPIKHAASLDSGISLEGARLLPQGSLHAELLLDLNSGFFPLHDGSQYLGDVIPVRTDAHVLLAAQVHPLFDVALDLPVTAYQRDNFALLAGMYPVPGVAAVGLGDPRVIGRVRLLEEARWPLSLAGVLEVRIPVGDGQSFLADSSPVIAPRVAVERTLGPFRVLGNLGMQFRPLPAQFLNLYVGNELTLGAGGVYRLPFDLRWFKQIDLLAELHLATPLEAPFNFDQADSLKSPFELQVGARSRLFGRWGVELSLGRGIALTTGYGREAFRAMAALTYDFVPGSSAEKDTDGDGIPDIDDKCPNEPEDKDGFQDDDGCPDPDNDNDGVLDGQDQCPNQAGPAALDGCPDRDGDEVPDIVDKCPDVFGVAEKEGCPADEPQVVLESDRIRIKGNIFFETASATLQQRSFSMLDEVFTVLTNNPDIGPVQVEGHTDNVGGRQYNLDLSERRAKSVEEYLIKKGVDAKRLRHKGFGFERPVATNATPLGRAKNRRVEFNLVPEGQKEGTKLQQVDEITAPPPGDAPDAGTGRPAEKPSAEKPLAVEPAAAKEQPDAGAPVVEVESKKAPSSPAKPSKTKAKAAKKPAKKKPAK